MTNEIEARLFALQDISYRDFHARLVPGLDKERIIGVRTPELRKLACEYAKHPDIEQFLNALPHRYYDENNLHGFIISQCRDYDRTVEYVDALLPYVDNWATCDLLKPKAFAKHRDRLPQDIERWLNSETVYTVRFGIEMIMTHFLDKDFEEKWLARVANINSDEYYINMMIAWFFATALTKQYDFALPYIETQHMDKWTHNKAIQKAIESHRITDDQKKYLRSLKIK